MARSDEVSAALATLRSRWGAAAPRTGAELGLTTEGALARAPLPLPVPAPSSAPDLAPVAPGSAPVAPGLVPGGRSEAPRPAPDGDGRVVPTGFAALDAILGPGGLPRTATVALRGDGSSGRTTVALRLAAEAQAAGSIVAWLDLARAFDPVEAVARGVRPEWLVVLTPVDLAEALALAGALLAARTVDVLVVDLPDGRDRAVRGARVGDRLGRLAALARRAGTLLVVLEPAALGRGLAAAVEEASGLRLEMERCGWIRLGRDVVGQRSAVTVARSRYGPPGRRAELAILYAEGGDRDACLLRDPLLAGLLPQAPPGVDPAGYPPGPGLPPPSAVESLPGESAALPGAGASPPGVAVSPPADREGPQPSIDSHASAAPGLASPAPAPRPFAPGAGRDAHDPRALRRNDVGGPRLRALAGRPDRPRGPALDGRERGGRGPARTGARRPARDVARGRPPARARGDLPRPRA